MVELLKGSKNHHEGARITTNYLLSKWKKGEWLNNFVTQDVATRKSSANFPSVDAEFDDSKSKAVISCEFKPATETKRGILTGLGQAVAYLNNADASYLIAPSEIDGFDMEKFLIQTFKNSIQGKLPVGLICFDQIDGMPQNIRLKVDIDQSLSCLNQTLKKGEVSYWAIWRDNPTIGIVRFLESCAIKTNNTADEKWKYFYDNFYAPPKTRASLELVSNDFYKFDPSKGYQTPFSTYKKNIQGYIDNKLTRAEIIKKGNYASVKKDGKVTKDKMYFFENLSNDEMLSQSDFMQLLANHGWEEGVLENLFQNYKKNYKNFGVHMNFISGDFKVTPLGQLFVNNCLKIIEETKDNFQEQSDRLNDELAKIVLVSGKHHNLILDLLDAQLAIPEDDNLGTIIEKCAKYMDAKGFLPRNPNRKTSGDRKFLQAEKQLWGHLGLMDENKKTNLLTFNNEKIEKLVDEFYKHYGTVYKL